MNAQTWNGLAYTLWGGRAYWGPSGRAPAANDPGTMTKIGLGTLALTATSGSARTNNVFINAGTVHVENAYALGQAGTVNVAGNSVVTSGSNAAATLEMQNISWGTLPLVQLNNNSTLKAIGTVRIGETGTGTAPTWTTGFSAAVTLLHQAQTQTDFFKINASFSSLLPGIADPSVITINPAFNAGIPGRVILTNASANYDGTWVVNTGGILQADSATAFGDNSPVPSSIKVQTGATLAVNTATLNDQVILDGGTLGSTGGNRAISITGVTNAPSVFVTDNGGFINLNDILTPLGATRVTSISGILSMNSANSVLTILTPNENLISGVTNVLAGLTLTNVNNVLNGGTIKINGSNGANGFVGVLNAQGQGSLGGNAARTPASSNW